MSPDLEPHLRQREAEVSEVNSSKPTHRPPQRREGRGGGMSCGTSIRPAPAVLAPGDLSGRQGRG